MRNETDQLVAAYSGYGGYASSPDENCDTIRYDEDSSEGYPSTIVEALSSLE